MTSNRQVSCLLAPARHAVGHYHADGCAYLGAARMVSAAAITQVALASWTATGWLSIPTTLSCNFFRVSVRDRPPEWLRMCSTAVSMNVPLPQDGSSTRWLRGAATTACRIVAVRFVGNLQQKVAGQEYIGAVPKVPFEVLCRGADVFRRG